MILCYSRAVSNVFYQTLGSRLKQKKNVSNELTYSKHLKTFLENSFTVQEEIGCLGGAFICFYLPKPFGKTISVNNESFWKVFKAPTSCILMSIKCTSHTCWCHQFWQFSQSKFWPKGQVG